MSRSRSRSPDTIDIEIDPASRNVRARLSPISGDPYLAGPSNAPDHTDSSDEDPSEDPETVPLAHSRTPTPLPSASPSPIPPHSPPTPPAPGSPPSPVAPSLSFSTRNHGVTLRWDWMPTLIRAWRNGERIPVIPTPEEIHTPTLTMTGEPIHFTIPVLVARIRTHDEQLGDVEHGVEGLQQQLEGVEGDLSEIRDEVVTTHLREAEDRADISTLRQEVATLRQGMAEMRAEMDRVRAELDRVRADAASTSR